VADQPKDHVDELVAQWRTERPDLDLAPMAVFGRLGRVAAHLTRAIEAVFAEHGLGVGEFDLLAALRRAGEPFAMRPTDLAHALMLSPAGTTHRLDRLEVVGWITRTPDPTSRRSSVVRLTASGRELVDRLVADHVANERALLEPLSPRELAAFDATLRKLLTQFE
jgi:DNA-binding MarR family transcriptional regulator